MEVKLKRKIFIGDIHGCYTELKKLLKKLDYNSKQDRLISLGDLINKGPASAKVLDFFMSNDLEVVKGNHEDWLYRALTGQCKLYEEAKTILSDSAYSKKEIIEGSQIISNILKQ